MEDIIFNGSQRILVVFFLDKEFLFDYIPFSVFCLFGFGLKNNKSLYEGKTVKILSLLTLWKSKEDFLLTLKH